MPTYSYACKDCGHAFDISQAFTDDALTVCPDCAGRLRKVWGSVGVVFKGSGFYRNDSRDADKKKPSPTSDAAGSGEKSSDSATAKSDAASGGSKDGSSATSAATTSSSSDTGSKSSGSKSSGSKSSGSKSSGSTGSSTSTGSGRGANSKPAS